MDANKELSPLTPPTPTPTPRSWSRTRWSATPWRMRRKGPRMEATTQAPVPNLLPKRGQTPWLSALRTVRNLTICWEETAGGVRNDHRQRPLNLAIAG